MTSTASQPVRSDRPMPPQSGPDQEARAAVLRAANINPRTGLATDYLNHFNEAIMLLEMVPDMPECAEDFLTWTLTAVGTAMREAQQDKTRATLAGQAIGWVKPLVALAGGIINGATEAD